jgi:hypothetical protein
MLRVTLRMGGFGHLTSKTQAIREVGKELGRRALIAAAARARADGYRLPDRLRTLTHDTRSPTNK